MMLDLFHDHLSSLGLSCDRQHFHGLLRSVDTRYHQMRSQSKGSKLLARCAEDYFKQFPVLAFDEAHATWQRYIVIRGRGS